MKKILYIGAVILQIAMLWLIIISYQDIKSNGKVVYAQMGGYDPDDLLRGHYVDITYPNLQNIELDWSDIHGRDNIYGYNSTGSHPIYPYTRAYVSLQMSGDIAVAVSHISSTQPSTGTYIRARVDHIYTQDNIYKYPYTIYKYDKDGKKTLLKSGECASEYQNDVNAGQRFGLSKIDFDSNGNNYNCDIMQYVGDKVDNKTNIHKINKLIPVLTGDIINKYYIEYEGVNSVLDYEGNTSNSTATKYGYLASNCVNPKATTISDKDYYNNVYDISGCNVKIYELSQAPDDIQNRDNMSWNISSNDLDVYDYILDIQDSNRYKVAQKLSVSLGYDLDRYFANHELALDIQDKLRNGTGLVGRKTNPDGKAIIDHVIIDGQKIE